MSGFEVGQLEILKEIEKNRAFSFDLEVGPRTFSKPSLLLAGRQDTAVGYYDAWSIVDKYPRMTFAVLDKASHDLEIEQEKVFNVLVNEWLDRLEEFAP